MSVVQQGDEFDDRTVSELFPSPISSLFTQQVLNTTDGERSVRGMVMTAENSLRYMAMLVMGEYALFPAQDEVLNNLLNSQDRPSFGSIRDFVWKGVRRLDERGHRWLVPELPRYVKTAAAARGLQTTRGGRQNLTDSLISLRNGLAHHQYQPDWAALLADYRPLFNEFLRHLRFLADYPLYRFIGEREPDHWVVAELMGSRETFTEKLIARPARFEGAASGVFLLSAHPSAVLPLHPFVVVEPCQDCARRPGLSGPPQEVFLLNGADGETTRFIGVRHKLLIKDPGVTAFRRRKAVSLPRIQAGLAAADVLHERAGKITSPFIDAQVQHGIYLPEVYVSRRGVEDELERFLANERAGFLLLGESGIGKTSLLCHTASKLMARSLVTLYYPAADLDFDSLDRQILSDLALEGALGDLLDSLSASGGEPLVLIIDGVNEHPQMSQAVRSLNELIRAHAGGKLKVVFSLRTSHFRQVLDTLSGARLDPEGISFFSPKVYHTARTASGERETYQHVLARVRGDSPELADMYERYRAADGATERRFCPLTPFDHLSRHVRDLVSNPWHLRLVLEIYHGREIPARIFSTDLMREYCQRLIYCREDTADFAETLVDAMCERTATSLTRSQMEAEPALKGFMTGSAYDASPFGRLVEDGVLVEYPELTRRGMFDTPRYRVQFAFDRVLEFLIANLLWSRGEPTPEGLQLLLSGSPGFAPFAGAVQAVWTYSAQQDGGDLILRCIDECDAAVIGPLVATLREMEAHGYEAYDRILAAIARGETFKSGLLLLSLGEGMSVENGVEAQNRVFEQLYEWRGEFSEAFRFLAGKALMFGYQLDGREEKSAEIYNQVQLLYSERTKISPDLLRVGGALTATQKERINGFAWLAEQCGMEAMARAMGRTTAVDEMLARLRLDGLPEPLWHDLSLVISLNAQFEAAMLSEATMGVFERIYEAELSGQPAAGLRAFDDISLNFKELILENLPGVRERVETELGFLCQAFRVAAAGLKDTSKLVENVIKVYVLDAREPSPSLTGRLSDFVDLINVNLIIADAYKNRGEVEKQINRLVRAEDYATAWEATNALPEIYGQLMKAVKKTGDAEAFTDYAKKYLMFDAYLSLSEETREILLRDDPFALLAKHLKMNPDEAADLNRRLENWCADSLDVRCTPWLTLEEWSQIRSSTTGVTRREAEAILSRRVFNYDKLRKEQRVLEVIRLFLAMSRDEFEELPEDNEDLVYRIQGRLRLMSMLSEWYRTAGEEEAAPEPAGGESRSNEYEQILEELRKSWPAASTEERMMGVAVAAVFPVFVPLLELEKDEVFCATLGKRAGTDASVAWIRSVMSCWCADVLKGRRGSPAVRDYLEKLPGGQLALTQSPHLVFTFSASFLFWARLKEQLNQELSNSLRDLSDGADNIELMIDALRSGLPSLRDWAADIVVEVKDELRQVHETLLADFG